MRDTIGRFRVVAKMGEGGTAAVYKCVEQDGDAFAAIKFPVNDTPSTRETLRREIAAVTRLARAKHEGIAQFLEAGELDGLPWYAMEYVEGKDLHAARRELWDDVLARGHAPRNGAEAGAGRLAELLELGARLARSLDFLHTEGLVHGDLTPANVLLREPGNEPVLIDFGTAYLPFHSGLARETVHGDGASRGTPGYMAPEQIKGEACDARCDLYALGCILYELVTGRPPFVASGVPALLRQHCRLAPEPPSRRVPGVPEALEGLILGLLEKEPRERVGRAREVALRLEALTGRAPLRGFVEAPPLLYRSELVGREPALERVLARLEKARAGSGGIVLVRGESGVGKTRLLNEILKRAARDGMLVLCNTGTPPIDSASGAGSGRPLGGFSPLFELLSDHCSGPQGDAWLADLRPQLEALRDHLPELAARVARDEPKLLLSPELAKTRVLRSVAELLRRVAGTGGVLLVIDDLQWTDELTLAFLEQHAPGLSSERIAILGSYRTEAESDALRALSAHGESIELERLSPAEIRTMVRELLGVRRLPDGLAEFLHQRSEGNPFFAAEYLRAVLAERALCADERGDWEFSPRALLPDAGLPESLAELLKLRTAGLSADAARIAELASVLGREFAATQLGSLVGAAPATQAAALEELVARQILEIQALGRYRFAHDKLREAQRASLPEQRRRELERLAAEQLESLDAVAHAAEIGTLWASAGAAARALPHLERAALARAQVHAFGRAAELYQLALRQYELLEVIPEGCSGPAAAREALGDSLVNLARHGDARLAYENAMRALPAEDRLARARLHRKAAASYWTLHEYAPAEAALESGAALLALPGGARAPEELEELIEIELGRFEQLYYSRKAGPLTSELLERLAPRVEAAGTPQQRVFYCLCVASNALACRRYAYTPEAVAHSRLALELASAAPDRFAEQAVLARFSLGFAALHGDADACRSALAELSQAALEAEALEMTTALSRITTYAAVALLRLRDVPGTRAAARRALAVAEAAQLPPYVAAAEACLAWAAWQDGDAASAKALAGSAFRRWRSHGHDFPFRWLASLPLLTFHASDGDLERSRPLLDDLLAENQQALPVELERALEDARRLCESDARAALGAIDAALKLARAHRLC